MEVLLDEVEKIYSYCIRLWTGLGSFWVQWLCHAAFHSATGCLSKVGKVWVGRKQVSCVKLPSDLGCVSDRKMQVTRKFQEIIRRLNTARTCTSLSESTPFASFQLKILIELFGTFCRGIRSISLGVADSWPRTLIVILVSLLFDHVIALDEIWLAKFMTAIFILQGNPSCRWPSLLPLCPVDTLNTPVLRCVTALRLLGGRLRLLIHCLM